MPRVDHPTQDSVRPHQIPPPHPAPPFPLNHKSSGSAPFNRNHPKIRYNNPFNLPPLALALRTARLLSNNVFNAVQHCPHSDSGSPPAHPLSAVIVLLISTSSYPYSFLCFWSWFYLVCRSSIRSRNTITAAESKLAHRSAENSCQNSESRTGESLCRRCVVAVGCLHACTPSTCDAAVNH